jgi:hypothetical protein
MIPRDSGIGNFLKAAGPPGVREVLIIIKNESETEGIER